MKRDVAVVGLGYVGLPLVREATRVGLTAVGFDLSSRVVEGLNAGLSHIDDVPASQVREMLAAGFVASTDAAVLGTAETIVICVPTPLDKRGGPDLGPVRSAAESVAKHLRAGQLVSLESTSYPGTTEEVVVPILETSGLKAGVDFSVGFSPERVDPGNPHFDTKNTPKIVSGIDEESASKMEAFYRGIVGTVVRATGTREAEAAKLLENTYRHVNIALVNELARVFHELKIDTWEVIRLASTKPFGFQPFSPGPGVGGHCIPIDPNYLNFHVSERLGYPVRLVALAQEVNSGMPNYVVQRAQDLLNADQIAMKGAKVLLLGVTYKPNISDTRESPAYPIAERLFDLEADVSFHDPYVEEWATAGKRLVRHDNIAEAVAAADVTILVQSHREYDVDALAALTPRFLDTRGVASPGLAERL